MLFDLGPLCTDFFTRNTHSLEFDKRIEDYTQNWDKNCFHTNQEPRPCPHDKSLTKEQETIVKMERAGDIPPGHLVKISAFAGTGKTETSIKHNLAVLDRHIQKSDAKNPEIRARCLILMVKLRPSHALSRTRIFSWPPNPRPQHTHHFSLTKLPKCSTKTV